MAEDWRRTGAWHRQLRMLARLGGTERTARGPGPRTRPGSARRDTGVRWRAHLAAVAAHGA